LKDALPRCKLDRRRIEAAHLQYAVLQVASWYKFDINKLALHSDTDATLSDVVKDYHGAFMAYYASHHCEDQRCRKILVLDGNMKNHRDVCAAKEAGFAEYDGLPGKVKTGCTETPQLQSRYCAAHMPTAYTSSTGGECSTPTGLDQVAFILERKNTRQNTLYKVARIGEATSNCTWEPESSLPPGLVAEYNEGVERELVESVYSSGGRTLHTLSSQPLLNQAKRPRVDEPVIDYSESILSTSDHTNIACKTQKDRVKLNYSTAGILAGIWPCGKIALVSELFGTESISQVYAALHTFLYQNADSVTDLDTICYDDGCHLKKYASKRADLTQTLKKISSYNIVIDKMHFKGHVDEWCHTHCNPYQLDHLNGIDTEVCEQSFSWLSRYARITRHMNTCHFLCDIHNKMMS
jgi:hypothetical protein